MRVCVDEYVYLCVFACTCVCVRACVRASVCACEHASGYIYVISAFSAPHQLT